MTPFLIGIAGLSGSGKTALASRLAPRLDDACRVITLDSYYHPQDHLSFEERVALNYDHPAALDWPLLAAHLENLRRGRPVDQPHYLFDRHTRAAETRRVDPAPHLILEGILALHTPAVRDLLDLKIFVSTPPEECLRRRLRRDIAERGRTRESVLEQYEKTVWPMAVEFVLPSAATADFVVSGEEPIEHSVEIVLRRLGHGRTATA